MHTQWSRAFWLVYLFPAAWQQLLWCALHICMWFHMVCQLELCNQDLCLLFSETKSNMLMRKQVYVNKPMNNMTKTIKYDNTMTHFTGFQVKAFQNTFYLSVKSYKLQIDPRTSISERTSICLPCLKHVVSYHHNMMMFVCYVHVVFDL